MLEIREYQTKDHAQRQERAALIVGDHLQKKAMLHFYAKEMARLGYHGFYLEQESELSQKEILSEMLIRFEQIETRMDINRDQILVIGIGMGAAAAIQAALQLGNRIDRLILHAGDYEKLSAKELQEVLAYPGKVLITHGTRDEVVNDRYAVRLRKELGQHKCHLKLIKGAGHIYEEGLWGAMLENMEEFLLDREEILNIDVHIHDVKEEKAGDMTEVRIYFGGSCSTPYFNGKIIGEGVDVQKYRKDEQISICADYTLSGYDQDGRKCKLHIVNTRDGARFSPKIETDSVALKFLSNQRCTAVLEGFEGGLTVRVFAERG